MVVWTTHTHTYLRKIKRQTPHKNNNKNKKHVCGKEIYREEEGKDCSN